MKNVFLGQFDTFSPDFAAKSQKEYAGELSLGCVCESSPFNAIRRMLDALEEEGTILKSIDYFGEIDEFSGNFKLFETNAKALSGAAKSSGEMVFSNLVAYEKDE